MELYKVLRQQRKKKGLSQRQVGVLIGVSKQMIQKYENGVAIPATPRLVELSKLLDFSISTSELKKNLKIVKKMQN